ncbi:MAG: methionyl-tRNA formyltransferase [Eubacteriales bacterium]|nr:methionyl-tRNA formyltransferase [Eubacteriales bacterium]
MIKIAFMGTPDFAVPSLDALVKAGYQVVGAFCQPDRPAGRHKRLMACPVKQRALELGIPVFQFERLRRQEGLDTLRRLEPDLVVTAAFGQILSQKLLDVPRLGTVNVHASLLPQYRGSAPINWCIVMGETETGVTTMLTDAGIDTGDILLSRRTPIGEMETADQLSARLSILGAELLVETLEKYLRGEIVPIPQDPEKASHQPMLSRETGRIDWSKSAQAIANLTRGLNPWPCAWTEGPEGVLKIYLARAANRASEAAPGTVVASSAKEGLYIACGEGVLEVLEMQAPNAKRMAAKAYLMGKKIDVGTVFHGETSHT